jgi:hypothetical protein
VSDELETIARFTDLTQAQNARAALQAADIRGLLRDEHTGSIDWFLMPVLGGLRLQVRSADVERAREILGELGLEHAAHAELDQRERGGHAENAGELEYREASRRRKRRVGLVAFLILFLPVLVAIVFGWLD